MTWRVRWLLLVLIVAVVIAVAVAGWRAVRAASRARQLVLYGNVDIRQVDLAFNSSERIEAMPVKEGETVRRGQVLARLDTTRLAPAVERAVALAESQAQVVARLEAGSRPEEIGQARANLAAAKAQAEQALFEYERTKVARERQAATPKELDIAKAAADAAAARRQAVEQALALVVAGPREEDIAAARATLRADQAQLARLQRELAEAELVAPADGVIQNRLLEPGDLASPQRAVYTLALTDPLWVRAYVSEADLGKLRPGMVAYVSTDTYPGRRYEGWVGFLSPTAEFTPKAVETPELRTALVYQVRIYVHNPQNELRLGMPATVTIDLDQPAPQTQTMPAETGQGE